MDNLYTYTNVKELCYKDFLNKNLKININNNKFGFIVFYSPNCECCKKDVYIWAELSSNFNNKFNIFAYNINNYKTDNQKIKEIYSFPMIPVVMSITKKGKLDKYKENINYDSLFYHICKKIKS